MPIPKIPTRSRRHGATLVVSIVLLSVLTVVALGMVRRGMMEVESAGAKRNYDTSVSCADGARGMLLGKFRAYGVDLSQITLDMTVANKRYATGHYDSFGVQSVVPVDKGSVGSGGENASDLSNRSVKLALGGAFYRVTVVCSDSTTGSRQSEVEFLIRFGL